MMIPSDQEAWLGEIREHRSQFFDLVVSVFGNSGIIEYCLWLSDNMYQFFSIDRSVLDDILFVILSYLQDAIVDESLEIQVRTQAIRRGASLFENVLSIYGESMLSPLMYWDILRIYDHNMLSHASREAIFSAVSDTLNEIISMNSGICDKSVLHALMHWDLESALDIARRIANRNQDGPLALQAQTTIEILEERHS